MKNIENLNDFLSRYFGNTQVKHSNRRPEFVKEVIKENRSFFKESKS